MSQTEQEERERLLELARFLRTRRERITPELAGLPSGGRRRTPGLRRGEIAMLAGVSVDWYTWLEQARNIKVSAQVLESLAGALRLDANERKHLFLLALQQVPAPSEPLSSEATASLQSFLDLQGTSPAYLCDLRLNVIAWNRAAHLVYGDYSHMTMRERNSVWRTFTSPYVRQLLGQHWERHARHRLAQFRASYAKFAGDAWWLAFIGELTLISDEFRAWWPQHEVLEAPEGRKINYHPTAGTLIFDQVSFQVTGAPDLTVTVNMPFADSGTEEKMRRLLQHAGPPGS